MPVYLYTVIIVDDIICWYCHVVCLHSLDGLVLFVTTAEQCSILVLLIYLIKKGVRH